MFIKACNSKMTLINSFIDSYRNIYALPSVLLFSYACFSLGSYHTNRNLNFDASRMPREGLQRKARSTAGSGTRTCSEKPDRSATEDTPILAQIMCMACGRLNCVYSKYAQKRKLCSLPTCNQMPPSTYHRRN